MTFAKSASERLEGRWRRDPLGRFIATAFAAGKFERAVVYNTVLVPLQNFILLCPRGEILLMGCLSNE